MHIDRLVVDEAALQAGSSTALTGAIEAGLASEIRNVAATRALPTGAERQVTDAIVQRLRGVPRVR